MQRLLVLHQLQPFLNFSLQMTRWRPTDFHFEVGSLFQKADAQCPQLLTVRVGAKLIVILTISGAPLFLKVDVIRKNFTTSALPSTGSVA